VTVVPATASFDEIMAHEPDGFFLSNGPRRPGGDRGICDPGDPQDAGDREAAVRHLPRPPASGARGRRQDVSKMFQGHRGANHPVKRLEDGRVEITSMNHGFAVEREGLPESVRETHVSCSTDRIAGSS
jgi:carbamoyl-phosphate synthase small subunit